VTYSFTVPNYLPPTLNAIMRGHLRTRMKKSRECHDLFGHYFKESGIPKATCKRRVMLKLTLGPRRNTFDVDAPWKGTLDALTACGAILGDRPDQCEITPLQQVRGEQSACEILLEDMT
jgi:hypothetical protein